MQCRYCLEETNPLVFPCDCKTPVHPKCLLKWRSVSNRTECEICQTSWAHKREKVSPCLSRTMWSTAVFATLCILATGHGKTVLKVLVVFFAVVITLMSTNIVIFMAMRRHIALYGAFALHC